VNNRKVILGTAGGLVAAGLFGYFMLHTMGEQRATKDEMDKMRRDFAAATAATQNGVPGTGNVNVVIGGGATTKASPELDKQDLIHRVITEGTRLLATGNARDAAAAEKVFEEGLANIDPKNAAFELGMGRAKLIQKDPAQAVHHFLKGLEVSKNSPDLWNGLARGYWELKDYYHAKAAYEQTLMLDDKSMEAWQVMAWVYLAIQERQKAITGFQVLVDSGAERIDWKNGLTMARSSNFDAEQIRSQFKDLPDPKLFLTPPATATSPGK